MCAKKSKAVKSRNKAARKIKQQERSAEQERLDLIRREWEAQQPPPPPPAPNNPYGIHNTTYSRYRPWIEKSKREQAQRETRLIDFEQFRLHRTFPDNIHEYAINASRRTRFESEADLQLIKDQPTELEWLGKANFLYTFLTREWQKEESISESSRSGVRGLASTLTRETDIPDPIKRSPILRRFNSVLGLRLAALFFDHDSLYFTFTPDSRDNDKAPIRIDFDFDYTRIYPRIESSEWFRAGEIYASPMSLKDPLNQLIGHQIVFCWSLFSEDWKQHTVHACFNNGKTLTISFNNEGFTLNVSDNQAEFTTLLDAAQVTLERDHPFDRGDLKSLAASTKRESATGNEHTSPSPP